MSYFKRIFFRIKYFYFSFLKKSINTNSYYGVKLFPLWEDQTFKFCFRGDYGDFFSNFLKKIDSQFVFIDIGANQGLYSIIAGKNSNCQKIYSVEPQKKILKVLKKNFEINNITRYEVLPYAISNVKSKAKLVKYKYHSGKGSLKQNEIISENHFEKIETIDSNFLKEIFNSSLNYVIKIDVEGHEDIVINEILKVKHLNKNSVIFYEVNTNWVDPKFIEEVLKKSGFKYFKKIGSSKTHYDVLATR